MLDYRLQIAAMEDLREKLGARTFSNATVGVRRDEFLKDVADAPQFAVLGSFIDHLFLHASSDGTENTLLNRAADLWKQAVALYSELGSFREILETALTDTTQVDMPQSLDASSKKMKRIMKEATESLAELSRLRKDIATFKHIPPHSRQSGEPVTHWLWSDIVLARRTDAFTRELLRRARTPTTRAFAFGALSRYGADAFGSAYLGQVVGGPRRLHRYRDRVARNTIGSWFASKNQPRFTRIANMLNHLGAVHPRALPSELESIIRDSASAVFEKRSIPEVPDLQRGYRRLVRNLELIYSFVLPPMPEAPMEPFLSRLYASPVSSPSIPVPEVLLDAVSGTSGASGVTPANFAAGSSTSPNNTDSSSSAGEACGGMFLAIFEFIGWLIGGWIYCATKWGVVATGKCDWWHAIQTNWKKGTNPAPEGREHGPQVGTSGEALSNLSDNSEVTEFVGAMFAAQSFLREGLSKAQAYLAIAGLIPPDDLLDRPVYRQFLSVQRVGADWPLREELHPVRSYHRFPATSPEHPLGPAPSFPLGATPAVILDGDPATGMTASAISVNLWVQQVTGSLDATNFDLDADRGSRFPCWENLQPLAADPINVTVLTYTRT
jgi:hypothetical protein